MGNSERRNERTSDQSTREKNCRQKLLLKNEKEKAETLSGSERWQRNRLTTPTTPSHDPPAIFNQTEESTWKHPRSSWPILTLDLLPAVGWRCLPPCISVRASGRRDLWIGIKLGLMPAMMLRAPASRPCSIGAREESDVPFDRVETCSPNHQFGDCMYGSYIKQQNMARRRSGVMSHC